MRFDSSHHSIQRFMWMFFSIALAVILVACGGTSNRDKQAAEVTASSSTSLGPNAAAVVEVQAVSGTFQAAAGSSTITATVKSASNVALEGQTVTFAATSGVLVVASATSDASGVVTATLTAGNDLAPRDITVTVTAASVSGSIVVTVTP